MAAVKSYAEVPLERLEHEITTLAAHIYAAECRWLLMIGEFDRREGWKTWGMTSCAEWLAFKCSLSPRTAREHVRIANSLAGLPLITASFAAGELSYSKVKALTRVAKKETEEDLMGIARHCSAAQLDTLASHYRRGANPEEELNEANRRHRDRYVHWHYDDYGMLKIEAYLDPEEGQLVAEALEAALDATYKAEKAEAAPPTSTNGSAEPLDGDAMAAICRVPADSADDTQKDEPQIRLPDAIHYYADPERSYLQRAADGLVMIAETYLEAGPMARKGGDRYQVILHVDHDVVMKSTSGNREDDVLDDPVAVPRDRCHIEGGPSLAPETMERILCDCSIVELVEKEGEPLDIGRKTRKIPTGMRRALEARDQCCQWPGCNRKRFTDGHHIKHWTRDKGKTELSNLTLLCRIHHRMVHEGGFRIEVTSDGRVQVFRPDDIELPRNPFMIAAGEGLEERNQAFEVEADAETCMTLDHGPMDHGAMIEGLLSTERLASAVS